MREDASENIQAEGVAGDLDDTELCGLCQATALGYARADDVRLCHPDEPYYPDCYTLVTVHERSLPDGRVWTAEKGWSDA